MMHVKMGIGAKILKWICFGSTVNKRKLKKEKTNKKIEREALATEKKMKMLERKINRENVKMFGKAAHNKLNLAKLISGKAKKNEKIAADPVEIIEKQKKKATQVRLSF